MTSERLHGGGHHEEGYDGNADQRQRSTRFNILRLALRRSKVARAR
jgi:hypothetical protein